MRGVSLAAMASLAAVVIAHPAYADRRVTGTVVSDATGAPIAGALVAVGAAEVATDDAGTFAIRDAPFGRLDLIVIADGYKAYFGSARAGGELAIRIEPEAGGSEVIHVSGQRPS